MTSTSRLPLRVVLADHHGIFRASLRQLLAVPAPVIKEVYGADVGAGFRVVGEAKSGEETVKVVESTDPELLLLDPSMPPISGLEALRELETHRDRMRTVLLAENVDKTQLLTAIQLGVRGLVSKDSSTELLFKAIGCVMAGEYWLGQTLVTDLIETVRPLIKSSRAPGGELAFGFTPRERDVLALVIAGCPNKEIACKCNVSEETIKHHLTRMFAKVGASNRLELAMVATQRGLNCAT